MTTQDTRYKTALDAVAEIDLTGKTAVVTGATSGLGQESVRALLAAGATVVLSGRDAAKVEATAAKFPDQNRIRTAIFDLSNLQSVARGAAEIADQVDKIDILINNAGIMAVPEQPSVDGIEMQFAANFVGHFLLTRLLLPRLVAAGQSRVINLSSGGHKLSDVRFDDFNFEEENYDKWLAYGQAKTAMSLFGVALTKRFSDQGLYSNAVHPGAVLTGLGRHMTREDIKDMVKGSAIADRKMVYLSAEEGAATQVWAATSPDLAGKGGLYLEKCTVAKIAAENDGQEDGVLSYALDEQNADKLWHLGERLVARFL